MRTHCKNTRKLRLLKGKRGPVLISPVFLLLIIKLDLPYKQPKKLLARLRLHIEMLSGNAYFPLITPTIAALTSLASELDDTITKIKAGDHSLIPHRKVLEKQGQEMIRLLAYCIQQLTKGDEEKIKSAGFDVCRRGGALQQPGQVLNLRAAPAGNGMIKLRWIRENLRRIYFIEQLIAGQWKGIGKTRNISYVVKGLTPGELYHFRVYAANGKLDGNVSDLVEQRSL